MTKEALFQAVQSSSTIREVALKFRVTPAVIYDRMDCWGISTDELQEKNDVTSPTLAEIEARCAEIRQSWTPRESMRRAGALSQQKWSTPAYSHNRRAGFVAGGASIAD